MRKKCYVLEGATWKGQLSEMKDSIVFIDEGNQFVFTDTFSRTIQQTDNYYVIVSREGLPNLPYSVTEIYGIRNGGYYAGLKQHYNEFYRIYGDDLPGENIRPDAVVTEDSNAGYQFFYSVCREQSIRCTSAGGKSNILKSIKHVSDQCILIVADGAAFGPEMDRTMKYLESHHNIYLYLPESFEWLILQTNPLKNPDIPRILESPAAYIESKDYFSWERYFTKLLTVRTQGTFLQYSKTRINPAYLKGKVKEAILDKIKNKIQNEVT